MPIPSAVQAQTEEEYRQTEYEALALDWEASEPLSLSFVSYSRLSQPDKHGEVHFQLITDEWPDKARDKIWKILQSGPMSEFLKLSGYAPAYMHQIIPMAAIKQPPLVLQAA